MATGFFYRDEFLRHDTGPGHAERPARLTSIMDELGRAGLLEKLTPIDAKPCDLKRIRRVHDGEMLESLQDDCLRAPFAIDEDTVVSAESFEIARLACGGVLAACDAVMEGRVRNAFCAVRPPGHHAESARAMGFCLINHVAVAARHLQEDHGLKRVIIVDWDVHHGNGTQEIFYEDPTVFYFSTHQWPLYPGTGAREERGSGAGLGFTLNCPLAAGSGDAEILHAFDEELAPAWRKFRPDFALISAGFDAHSGDPLAGLEVSDEGYAKLTERVMKLAAETCQGRVVSVLEGGYELGALARSARRHVEALLHR